MDIVGVRVRLRPLRAADRTAVVRIRRTPEVRARWRGDDLEAEYDAELADPDLHAFAILDDQGRLVGQIQYAEELDRDYRSAGIDVFVDPAHHRRGLASDAIRALIEHLVTERGHHRLTIDPAADNAAAIACYASVGFRVVGVLRAYERQGDGTWADGLLMDLLAEDLPDHQLGHVQHCSAVGGSAGSGETSPSGRTPRRLAT